MVTPANCPLASSLEGHLSTARDLSWLQQPCHEQDAAALSWLIHLLKTMTYLMTPPTARGSSHPMHRRTHSREADSCLGWMVSMLSAWAAQLQGLEATPGFTSPTA